MKKYNIPKLSYLISFNPQKSIIYGIRIVESSVNSFLWTSHFLENLSANQRQAFILTQDEKKTRNGLVR